MDMGEFRGYISADGTDVVRTWLDQQTGTVRGAVSAILETLGSLNRNRWPKDYFKTLTKRAASDCVGLDEIIAIVDGAHYRILGFEGPADGDFTMLYPFNKQIDARYKVPCEEANNRKAEISRDWTRAKKWTLG